MDTTQIITGLIGLLSGGGIIAAVAKLRASRLDDFKAIKEVYQEENARLRQERSDCQKECDDCKDANSKLILAIAIGKNSPIPYWVKDAGGTMLFLNTAYEKVFLIPSGLSASDYIGKTDIEFWGPEIGETYRKDDLEAMKHEGRLFKGKEPITVSGSDVSALWRIAKWGIWSNGVCMGSAGMAFPHIE